MAKLNKVKKLEINWKRSFPSLKCLLTKREGNKNPLLSRMFAWETHQIWTPVRMSLFEYRDYKITLIDTAGIRRRGKIVGIEKYALYRTEEMLKEADIALLVPSTTYHNRSL